MSISKEDLLRQLEAIEKEEADELASQSIEKPKSKVIRVVQASKRAKNPKQQTRTPAQQEATRKMLEARKKKLAEKNPVAEKNDEIVMVIEPPKKERKPNTRKVQPEAEAELPPPPKLRRSVNVAVAKRAKKKVEVIYEESQSESSGDEYPDDNVIYATQPIPIPQPQPPVFTRRDKRFS